MPLTIRRCLTARKTVLSLLLLLSLVIVLSYLIPQRSTTRIDQFLAWQEAHPAWLPITESLGLHRLFTAPWFVALLFVFLLSLALTTHEQFRLAQTRTFARGAAPPSSLPDTKAQEILPPLPLTAEALTRGFNRQGYYRLGGTNATLRFVRHPWGYWGMFLLHLGIAITVASSLLVAATEKKGVMRLAEGETFTPGSPWLFEEHGLFAEPLRLAEPLGLDRVSPEFWDKGGVKNVRSAVRFLAQDGRMSNQTIALEPILNYQGVRHYHAGNFGHRFDVVLVDQSGKQGRVILDIATPLKTGEASYGNFDFEDIPYRIKAKYYADADKKSLVSDSPLLVLRLMDDQTILGELSLTRGESGRLGPYAARLVAVKRWAVFDCVETTGMPGVFVGFFVIVLGSALNYGTIPREFHCRQGEQGYLLTWQGSRFQHLYQGEGLAVHARLAGQAWT